MPTQKPGASGRTASVEISTSEVIYGHLPSLCFFHSPFLFLFRHYCLSNCLSVSSGRQHLCLLRCFFILAFLLEWDFFWCEQLESRRHTRHGSLERNNESLLLLILERFYFWPRAGPRTAFLLFNGKIEHRRIHVQAFPQHCPEQNGHDVMFSFFTHLIHTNTLGVWAFLFFCFLRLFTWCRRWFLSHLGRQSYRKLVPSILA